MISSGVQVTRRLGKVVRGHLLNLGKMLAKVIDLSRVSTLREK